MKSTGRILLAAIMTLAVAGCDSRERTDSGGVIIAIGDLQGFPTVLSANDELATGAVSLGSVVLRSILAQPNQGSTGLMDITLQSYEVTYSRGDGGTRVPPPLVRNYTGSLPAGGTFTAGGVVILWADQINAQPISDLFLQNGGIDRETGRQTVILNYNLRFFGRTISGREIESPVIRETIEITR
jgi:hypothetical protein